MLRFFSVFVMVSVLSIISCGFKNPVSKPLDSTAAVSGTKNTGPKTGNISDKQNLSPQILFEKKKYNEALMAALGAEPDMLSHPDSIKTLWKINDRLVTAQWYLQKSIIALTKGQKDTAVYHVNEALRIYPDHGPSAVLKQKLASLSIREPEKPKVKRPETIKKKKRKNKEPSKEELKLAEYYLSAGKVYFKDSQFSLAKDSWRRGLSIAPSHGELKSSLIQLLVNEGLRFFGQGDIQTSIKRWEEALEISPGDAEIQGYLDIAKKAEEKIRSIK